MHDLTSLPSRTEPEAFFLELHFNAHPVAQPNAKEKPRVTNALVPTLIAYPGGRMQFDVNMSSEVRYNAPMWFNIAHAAH